MSGLDETEIIDVEALKAFRPNCALLAVISLAEAGGDRFDPVRFRYIDSMARRALEQRESVTLAIEGKVLEALRVYQADFDRAREEAEIVVASVASQHPESAKSVRELFESGDFKKVKRLQARLEKVHSQGALADLTDQIMRGVGYSEEEGPPPSLDDFLRQQENDVVRSFTGPEMDFDVYQSGESALRELKSIRSFRESWAKLSSDRLVSRAVKEGPEDPGPLNPQMLAVRSLSVMRDLSPAYLSRYVSYVDTLLWLEQVGENTEFEAPKKGAGKSKQMGTAGRKN